MASPHKRGTIYGILDHYYTVDADGKKKRHQKWIPVSRFKDIRDEKFRAYQGDKDRARAGLPLHNVPYAHFMARFLQWYHTYYAPSEWRRAEFVLSGIKAETIADFNPEHIEPWIAGCKASGTKTTTINRYLNVIRSAGRQMKEWYHLHESPVERIRGFKRERHITTLYATDEEISRVLAVIPPDSCWSRMLYAAIWTGLRRSELCFLQWEDVDFREGVLYVRSKEGWTPKGLKERAVVVPKDMLATMSLWKQSALTAWVFTGADNARVDPDVMSSMFRKFILKAGVRPGISFHKFRKSYATKMGGAGGAAVVRDALGHSSLETTQLYVGHDLQRMREVTAKISYNVPPPTTKPADNVLSTGSSRRRNNK